MINLLIYSIKTSSPVMTNFSSLIDCFWTLHEIQYMLELSLDATLQTLHFFQPVDTDDAVVSCSIMSDLVSE